MMNRARFLPFSSSRPSSDSSQSLVSSGSMSGIWLSSPSAVMAGRVPGLAMRAPHDLQRRERWGTPGVGDRRDNPILSLMILSLAGDAAQSRPLVDLVRGVQPRD